MHKILRRTEKPCFFPYFLFHCIPPYFRIEKGRIREVPSHAFPIGRREKNIKGEGEKGKTYGKCSADTLRSFLRALLNAGKSIIIERKMSHRSAGKGKEKQ